MNVDIKKIMTKYVNKNVWINVHIINALKNVINLVI